MGGGQCVECIVLAAHSQQSAAASQGDSSAESADVQVCGQLVSTPRDLQESVHGVIDVAIKSKGRAPC